MANNIKTLEYYRTLPYQRTVRIEEEEGEKYYVARIVELSGCLATGDTRQEALFNLKTAFDEMIEALLEWGSDIPVPERKYEPAEPVVTRVFVIPSIASCGPLAQIVKYQSDLEELPTEKPWLWKSEGFPRPEQTVLPV